MAAPEVVFAIDDYSAAMPHGISDDDHELRLALGRRGIAVRPLVWGHATGSGAVRPGTVVVIRSTWDYVERPDRFLAWLDHLDRVGAVVYNPTATIRWNIHKRYLTDLGGRGVPVVPTRLVARGSRVTLAELTEATGWDDVVVKPAIGATARLTIHQGREGTAATAAHFARVLDAEDVLVQPFVPSITEEGEISVVAVDGTPVHAVRKRAKAGDWRVQYDFGGTVERIDLDDELDHTARSVLGALDEAPLYARVDVARLDGHLHLMELELIEPNLFLDLIPASAELLADALAARLTVPPADRAAG